VMMNDSSSFVAFVAMMRSLKVVFFRK